MNKYSEKFTIYLCGLKEAAQQFTFYKDLGVIDDILSEYTCRMTRKKNGLL